MNQVNNTKVQCSKCSTIADYSTDPHAWDGWQVSPEEICPDCLDEKSTPTKE